MSFGRGLNRCLLSRVKAAGQVCLLDMAEVEEGALRLACHWCTEVFFGVNFKMTGWLKKVVDQQKKKLKKDELGWKQCSFTSFTADPFFVYAL